MSLSILMIGTLSTNGLHATGDKINEITLASLIS